MSGVDSRLFVVSVTMRINSLEIIKHSKSTTQTKACVFAEGSRVRAYAITMDFKMFFLA